MAQTYVGCMCYLKISKRYVYSNLKLSVVGRMIDIDNQSGVEPFFFFSYN
jgi:hypothetical protein